MRNWIIGFVLLTIIPGCADAPEPKQSCILYSDPVNGDYIPSFRLTGRSKEAIKFNCIEQPIQAIEETEPSVKVTIKNSGASYTHLQADEILKMCRNVPIENNNVVFNYTIVNKEAAKELGIIR
jgi:hypothetical protein